MYGKDDSQTVNDINEDATSLKWKDEETKNS